MKLTPRLTLVFIAYALALLLSVGMFAYSNGRSSLRAATASELQSIALEKEAALNRWVQDKQQDIAALAANPTVQQAAARLLSAPPGSAESRAAHDQFMAQVSARLRSSEFLDISLIHPQTGQVIASTDPTEEGKFKEDRPYFQQGRSAPFVQDLYHSIALQSVAMTAAAPLLTADGQPLGVLAAHLDLRDMNAIFARRTGLHETDDAFLVNTSSLFVTQPRFIESPAVLRRGIHTDDIRSCLQGQSAVSEVLDYREHPAIVAYRWLPERRLCLVVKLDQTEAYAPARAFGLKIALGSAGALLAAALVGYALSRSVTGPILALRSGAARFGRGELGTRLPEDSRDELGELAREFNRMAEALARQQTHLQHRAEQFFNLTLDLLCTLSPDGRLIDLNPAWEQTLGYRREDLRDCLLIDYVHPEDRPATAGTLQRLTRERSRVRFEARFRDQAGGYHWLAWALVAAPADDLLYGAGRDVTERRLAEEQLRHQAHELEQSNRELEQFAYVASHDLQEPLRIVSSYLQLLERRYRGRLGQDADEFISFAVEGANRMKSLISDLLAYSRVGTRGKELAPVVMEDVLERVTHNLRMAVEESGAVLTHDPLPDVQADSTQMIQMLQNLIANSIKFRGADPPRIHVGVRRQDDHWLFFVRDNGIGIDPQYAELIFVIFQRLHNRDQYPGTGIGLAICRKIVERHGGRIWVESQPGKGATFYFTLEPAREAPLEAAQPLPARARDSVADRATDLI